MPLDIIYVHFNCPGSQNLGAGGRRRLLLATALSLRRRAHFDTWWSFFRGRCKGNLVFWFSKVDFSWQVQGIEIVLFRNALFVSGIALWTWRGSSRNSDFLTGAMNRDFWRNGSFADFVVDATLGDPRNADFVAGAILGEPRYTDFVAGATLGEPRNADFVAGAALG